MAEFTAGYRWAWSFSGPRPTADDLRGAINAYVRRHNGRFPSLLFIHPDHLVEGLQPPLGLIVEADRHINRSLLEFAIPEDEAPAEVERLTASALSFWVFPHLAFLGPDQLIRAGEPLPFNGLSLLAFLLIGLAIALAFRQMIRGLRR